MISKPTLLEYGPCRFLITDCPTDANVHAYVDVFKKRQVTSLVRACDPSYNTAALNAVNIEVYDVAFPDGDPPPDRVVDRWLDVVEKTFHSTAQLNKTQPQRIAATSPANAKLSLSPNGHSRANAELTASGNGSGSGLCNGNGQPDGMAVATGTETAKDGLSEMKDGAPASNGHAPHPSSASASASAGSASGGPCVAVHCVAGLGRAPVLVAIALIEEGMSALDAIAFIRKKRRGALNAKQLKWLETYQRRRKPSTACCAII